MLFTRKFLGLFLLMFFLSLGWNYQGVKADDRTAQLHSLTLDKKETKVGEDLFFSMDATATGGNIRYVYLEYQAVDDEAKPLQTILLYQKDATSLWQGTLKIPAYMAKGNWKIKYVTFDIDGYNYVISNSHLINHEKSIDLSSGDFYVDPTGYQPELLGVTIDKNKGTIGDKVSLRVAVKEVAENRYSEVRIYYRSPSNKEKTYWYYTAHSSQTNFIISPNDEKGSWVVDRILLRDTGTSNSKVYYNELFYDKPSSMDFSQLTYNVLPAIGWIEYLDNWYYYDSNSEKVTGWLEDEGYYYYLDEDGARYSGWLEVDGEEYFFDDDGKMVTGWYYDDEYGVTLYFNEDGQLMHGFQEIDGHWYLFDEDGVMVTGWTSVDGKNYYFDEYGEVLSGWAQLDGEWFYFLEKGQAATGWKLLGGNWYYLQTDGAMATGLFKAGGSIYYADQSGAMKTGWKQLGGKWYYFTPVSGHTTVGWLYQGKVWYHFDENGVMADGWRKIHYQRPNWPMINAWFYFDGNGAMQTGWKYLGGKWYYLEGDGVMAVGTQTLGGVKYLFKGSGEMASNEWYSPAPKYWYYYLPSGKMATGWQTINGKKYFFDSNGVWVK